MRLAQPANAELSPPDGRCEIRIDTGTVGPDSSVLACVRYGDEDLSGDHDLTVRLPLPWLGGLRSETWVGDSPVRVERDRARGEFAFDGRRLFGVIESGVVNDDDLEPETFSLYDRLFELIREQGAPNLLRVWAVVPFINEEADGVERYKIFCQARADAWEKHCGAGFEHLLPASSAVGNRGDRLVLHFLASRFEGTHVENPRQVSAYHYPKTYGPRSPSFARATILPAELGGSMFVSGTSSIVGHETVHEGSIEGQLEETIRNIDELLSCKGERFNVSSLKVYVRNEEDLEVVRSRLKIWTGPTVPVTVLQADICRESLLVEVEAIADSAGC